MTPQSKLLALTAAITACAVLAACGGSGSDPLKSTAANREEAALKFARCMRAHGVEVETSTQGEGVGVHIQSQGEAGEAGAPSEQALEAAQKACQRYQEALAPKLTPQEKVQREEALQKFAACMRQHGIHVESGGGPDGALAVRIGRKSGAAGANPESATFQKAQEDCSALLPHKPGAPRGGPPPLPKHPTGGKAAGSGSGGEEGSQTFVAP